MNFDMTVTLGAVLNMLAMLGGGVWFMITVNTKLSTLIAERKQEYMANIGRFEEIDKQLEKLIAVTIQLAKVEERINSLDVKFNDLLLPRRARRGR